MGQARACAKTTRRPASRRVLARSVAVALSADGPPSSRGIAWPWSSGQSVLAPLEPGFVNHMLTARRRGLLPFALLAVLLQVVLPVAMIGAAARALDPLGGMTICQPGTESMPSPDGGGQSDHNHPCPICPSGISYAATAQAPSAAWLVPPRVAASRYADPALSPNPRAPPTAWRHSRAPPVLS